MPVAERLLVVALGGNALSPPGGAQSYDVERASIARAAVALAALAAQGWRLLVVHGNGPQVGRLLRDDADADDLDLHVAQTQGELGVLLAEAIEREAAAPTVAVVTRVLVDAHDAAFAAPTKPIGPVLATPPPGAACVAVAGGWRRVVASPRPLQVVEQDAIATLLRTHHVIAGGGGGVALAREVLRSRGLAVVVDKDRVAARLAITLDAQALVFATDVAGVEDAHATPQARLRPRLTVADAQALLAAGVLGAGSMGPKVESAADYVAATGRSARIVHADAIAAAFDGSAPGTVVVPGR
mgnify:CR=1 FL=1